MDAIFLTTTFPYTVRINSNLKFEIKILGIKTAQESFNYENTIIYQSPY